MGPPSRAEVLPVGPPVQRRFQIGREGDIARLVDELRQGEDTVISGPRRIGKSTVALAALELLADDGYLVCALDCRQAPSSAALTMELDAQRRANRSPLQTEARRAGGFALRLWRTLVAGEEHADVDERLADAVAEQLLQGDDSANIGDAFAALERAADDHGVVVFFDEAHWLQHLDDVTAAIRGVMTDPSSPITFLFAGSHESLMESLFSAGGLLEVQGQPFGLSAILDHLWLEGLRAHCQDYLSVTISRSAIDAILDASGGHPYRTMLAANRAHALARELEVSNIDDGVAYQAIDRARADRRWSLP